MDMSFANQALSVEYLVKNDATLEKKVYAVPEELDKKVARLKLESMGVKIDRLHAGAGRVPGELGRGNVEQSSVAGGGTGLTQFAASRANSGREHTQGGPAATPPAGPLLFPFPRRALSKARSLFALRVRIDGLVRSTIPPNRQ